MGYMKAIQEQQGVERNAQHILDDISKTQIANELKVNPKGVLQEKNEQIMDLVDKYTKPGGEGLLELVEDIKN